MTEDELRVIEARGAGRPGDVDALIDEVRRLRQAWERHVADRLRPRTGDGAGRECRQRGD